jgi:hypothetical protein
VIDGNRTRDARATTLCLTIWLRPPLRGPKAPVRVTGIEPAGASTQSSRCTMQLHPVTSSERRESNPRYSLYPKQAPYH